MGVAMGTRVDVRSFSACLLTVTRSHMLHNINRSYFGGTRAESDCADDVYVEIAESDPGLLAGQEYAHQRGTSVSFVTHLQFLYVPKVSRTPGMLCVTE
jgi:hypothetical protein